jgi:CspA family cold shock protein
MVFRDQQLVCENCGRKYVFTVTEQRRLAEELGVEEVTPPHLCPDCRSRDQPAARTKVEPAPQEAKRASPVAQPAVRPTAVDQFPLEEAGIEVKLIGEVKWFSHKKGYGFITKADGQDVFFHRSDVAEGQLSEIRDKQRVEFHMRQTDKGPEAFDVSLLPAP